MQLIPVIDLMDGCVVHAKEGLRETYQPIQSPLCPDCSPHAVIDSLLGLHPFGTIYVADLDALTGKGNHQRLLRRLQEDYPAVQFWLDQGLPQAAWFAHPANALAVIGTESLNSEASAWMAQKRGDFILSLDFIGGELLGGEHLPKDCRLWPDKLIVMTLSRVGSGSGPDFGLLEAWQAHCPEKTLIAAGGVRDEADICQLRNIGCGGVLLASAIHSGRLDASFLADYCLETQP